VDWKTCNNKKLVKNVKIDHDLINALIESSSKKFQTFNLLELTDITASSKISLIYDSLREILEAIAISKGYKIYNHECYSALLNEILEKSDLGKEFDNFRKIRNSINYYGKNVDMNETIEILKEMGKFRRNLKKLYSS
jgi:uncharacterized protein (UPF0332 family)